MSVYTTVFAGSSPFGGMFIGTVASTAGIAVAVAIGGSLTLLVGLVALGVVRAQAAFQAIPVPAARRAGDAAVTSQVEGTGIADAIAGSAPRGR
jgi:hypothetical protein